MINRCQAGFLGIAALLVALAATSPLYSALNCSVEQLTATTDSFHGGATITPDGELIAYSRDDSMGTYTDSQIHLLRLIDRTSGVLTTGLGFKGNPSLSRSGSSLSFSSQADHTGGNADGNFEVFALDSDSSSYDQVTTSTSRNNLNAKISGSGELVLLVTRNDLVGQNPSGSFQYFSYDRPADDIQQLTFGTDISSIFDIDIDGRLLAFQAEDDFIGLNPDGNEEIFVLDTAAGSIEQVTRTVGGRNTRPSTNETGSRMAFFSTSPDLVGDDPTGLPHLFLYDSTSSSFEQFADSSANFFSALISGDGSRVVASLDCVVKLWDLTTGESIEVLQPEGPSSCLNDITDINRDGSRIVVRSFGEPVGSNPEGNIELFLVLCPRSALFSDGFESGDLAAWSSRAPRPGDLIVSTDAAAPGSDEGLEIAIDSSCSEGTERVLPPPPVLQGEYLACSRLRAGGVSVGSAGATLRAGDFIALGNDITADSDTTLTLELDPTMSPFAWVEHSTLGGVTHYAAHFSLRVDEMSIGVGDEVEHLNGYSATGQLIFAVSVRRGSTLDSRELVLSARNDDGDSTQTQTGEEIPLALGWNNVAVSWRNGDGTGHLMASVNGGPFSGLGSLTNAGLMIDFVRWGVVGGIVDATTGAIQMDEFVNSR